MVKELVIKKQVTIWNEMPLRVGVLLTLLVFAVFVVSLFWGKVCVPGEACISKWEDLVNAPSNEIGDTLAGFAGTLAFVWLIVTVFLQATELREQRAEFEKIAQAQEKQVELLISQGDIFSDEHRQRVEARKADELKQRLRNLVVLLGAKAANFSWTFSRYETEFFAGSGDWITTEFLPPRDPSLSDTEWLASLADHFAQLPGIIEESAGMSGARCNPKRTSILDEVIASLDGILSMRNELGVVEQLSVSGMRLEETHKALVKLVAMEEHWCRPHWDDYE